MLPQVSGVLNMGPDAAFSIERLGIKTSFKVALGLPSQLHGRTCAPFSRPAVLPHH